MATQTISPIPVAAPKQDGAAKSSTDKTALTLEQATKLAADQTTALAELHAKLAAVPFNPFTVLSIEQTSALVSRLNPTWRDTKSGDIKTAALERKINENESTILVWLQWLADEALEARLLSSKLTSGRSLLENVAAGSTASLVLMAEDYKSLPPTSLKAYRIGIRDRIFGKWAGETANRILAKVMDATEAKPESIWMR